MVLLAVWLPNVLMHERESVVLSPIFFLVLALTGTMLLSCVNGRLLSLRILAMQQTKTLMAFVLLGLLLQTWPLFRHFLRSLVVVTALSAAIGILQEILFMATGMLFVGSVESRTIRLLLEPTSFGTCYVSRHSSECAGFR